MPLDAERLRAITVDLDDTLWPIAPVIARAEAVLAAWLAAGAPRVAQRFDRRGMLALRAEVERERPQLAHDLTALRRETLRRALREAGEDEALSDPAFEVFYAERHRVEPYADAWPALQRLAARWPLAALSNGNADPDRIAGLGGRFQLAVSAREVGVGKPDRRIFEAACTRLGCRPDEVLHVGDDLALDMLGAHEAGLCTAWVRRRDDDASILTAAFPGWTPDWQGPDLLALCDALGA